MAFLARRLPLELVASIRTSASLAVQPGRCYATSTDEQRDIVIVGGGAAGLALAASLSELCHAHYVATPMLRAHSGLDQDSIKLQHRSHRRFRAGQAQSMVTYARTI